MIARCLLLVTPLLIALLRIWWLFKVAGIDRATSSGSTLRKIWLVMFFFHFLIALFFSRFSCREKSWLGNDRTTAAHIEFDAMIVK